MKGEPVTPKYIVTSQVFEDDEDSLEGCRGFRCLRDAVEYAKGQVYVYGIESGVYRLTRFVERQPCVVKTD